MTREELGAILGQLNSEETTAADRANFIQQLSTEFDSMQATQTQLENDLAFEKSEKEKFALSNSQLLSRIGVQQPTQTQETQEETPTRMSFDDLFKGGK